MSAIIITLAIASIVVLAFLVLYTGICLLNKWFNLDANGNPVRPIIQQEVAPQIIKIELSPGIFNQIPTTQQSANDTQKVIKCTPKKQEEVNPVLFNASTAEVESSWKGKRIGKVE